MKFTLKIFYISALIVLLPYFIQAQYVSRLGYFEVDQIKGCAPLIVNITPILQPCNGLTPCDIIYQLTDLTADCNAAFASGTPIVQNSFPSPPYPPGKYKLTVLMQNQTCDDIIIEVLPNIQPDFEIYHCSGNEVSVKVTDTNYNYQYKIDYNDGNPVTTVAAGNTAKDNHTFATTGIKNIEVRGVIASDAADNCSPKTDTVKIRNVPLPSFSQLEVLTPSSIQLDFVNQNHVLYKLEIAVNNNTTFQPLQNIYNSNTTTITSNITPDNNFYCFRLGKNDPCTNTTNYAIDKICSANFDAVAVNNENDLSWSTSSSGIANYTISKNPGTAIPSQASSSTSYFDTDVLCETYTYQLTSNYSSNNIKSISLPKTVTSFSNNIPPAIANITTSLNSDGTSATLTWQAGSQAQEYSIFRGNSLLTTTTTEQYTDDSYKVDANYCYGISYKNQCNNTSPIMETCPVKLESNLQEDNSVVLTWNAYTGWENNVSQYVVEKYTADGQFIGTVYSGTNTTYTDNNPDQTNQAFFYIIKSFPNDVGVTAPATSNKNDIILDPKILFPNAFTPDSPPLNETFKAVKKVFIDRFEMQIFNRWGELVYATNDIDQGWDGTFRGSTLPEGIYAFITRLTDKLGRKFTNSGSLILIRKK